MLTQDEVKRYAHLRRLRLVDQIWKDYLQDVVLHLLARTVPGFVFGGGTALWKLLQGDRFSEDIDGYAPELPEGLAARLSKELALLGVDCTITKHRRTVNMLFLDLELAFPSHPRPVRIAVELLRGRPPATPATLYPPYPDLPPVELLMLAPEELLANKVSAVYGRDKPRDVHDLYLLLKRGVPIDAARVRAKVPRFSLASFQRALREKEPGWESLEALIVTKLPGFEEELASIVRAFQKAMDG